MNEGGLEQEIKMLSEQIEQKRAQLEAEKGFVPEDKEALQEVVREEVYSAASDVSVQNSNSNDSTGSGSHYLDALDGENVQKVNELIEGLEKRGLKKTIEQAKREEPFVLDAFHDALVDRLYGELKGRGHIK